MMAAKALQLTHRKDYAPPDFVLPEVWLDFDLDAEMTRVRSRMRFERRVEEASSLVLAGDELQLVSVQLNGTRLEENEYRASPERLEIFAVPEAFELEVVTQIRPAGNTKLMGLYVSGETLCTQCEPEGFRRITYAPDRPDVLMRVTTRINADETRYPVVLANGNCVSRTADGDGRRTWVWEDPFPKPSYLFALVAGRFAELSDEFVTMSGRRVALRIYAAAKHLARCDFAMQALKRAMRWDEEVFGREYDLDTFMIVAVEDFNFGAMENKGLNLFNSSLILASPDTATDATYARIEAVVAHEYFHNWSGNRVTCRDWFQLSLKEGFTVFRDQEFSSDMHSRTLRRMQAVNFLRDVQFAEDAGPLAHPVRPDSYMEIANFYTATVYEKGAELVRMLHRLLGPERFRRGSDLYFAQFDGQAVTIEDFVDAMSEASGVDLTRFKCWYSRAGTPRVRVATQSGDGVLELVLTQFGAGGDSEAPLHIPFAFGLLDEQGRELLGAAGGATLDTSARVENPCADGTLVLHLEQRETRVRITLADAEQALPDASGDGVTLSLLRGFSAPIILQAERSLASLAFLARHDTDGFSRWDAVQTLFSQEIHRLRRAQAESSDAEQSAPVSELVLELAGDLLAESLTAKDDGEHKAVLAAMLVPPSETTLLGQLARYDIEGVFAARRALRRAIAMRHGELLRRVFDANQAARPYRMDAAEAAKRSLRHLALGLLCATGAGEVRALVEQLMEQADNLTERLAGLCLVVDSELFEEAQAAAVLEAFAERWQDEKLVMDRWYAAQAGSCRPGGVERVMRLEQRQDFVLSNPNRVAALYGAFARSGLPSFHDPTGIGYRLIKERVLRLSPINPQSAARLAVPLTEHGRLDSVRAPLMRRELKSLLDAPQMPKDLVEIVTKALG